MYTAKSELNKGNAHAKKNRKERITGEDEERRGNGRVGEKQWQKSGLKFERDDTST